MTHGLQVIQTELIIKMLDKLVWRMCYQLPATAFSFFLLTCAKSTELQGKQGLKRERLSSLLSGGTRRR